MQTYTFACLPTRPIIQQRCCASCSTLKTIMFLYKCKNTRFPTRPIIQQHCILFNIKNINFNKLLRCKEHSTHTYLNDKEPQYFIYRMSKPKPHNHLHTWQKHKSKVAQNLYQHKTYAAYFSF